MNTMIHNLRTKRCPAGEPQDANRLRARSWQTGMRSALTRGEASSNLADRTIMNRATSIIGVVTCARLAGGQRVFCARSSAEERPAYTRRVGGSNPSARTVRMRTGASIEAGTQGAQIFHKDPAIGSSPITGTVPRRRCTDIGLFRVGVV